jgi:hypothetical protein
MKEKSLLERVRELSRLILKSEQDTLNIQAGLESMAALLGAASLIVDSDGKRIGEAYPAAWPCERLRDENAARGDSCRLQRNCRPQSRPANPGLILPFTRGAANRRQAMVKDALTGICT